MTDTNKKYTTRGKRFTPYNQTNGMLFHDVLINVHTKPEIIVRHPIPGCWVQRGKSHIQWSKSGK